MSSETAAWVAAGAGLLGALIGAAGGGVVGWLAWKRQLATRWDQERRKVYAQFLRTVEEVHESLQLALMGVIAHGGAGSLDKTTHRLFERAGERGEQTRRLLSEIEILASSAVRDAAVALRRSQQTYIADARAAQSLDWVDPQTSEALAIAVSRVTRRDVDVGAGALDSARREFVEAVQAELGISPAGE